MSRNPFTHACVAAALLTAALLAGCAARREDMPLADRVANASTRSCTADVNVTLAAPAGGASAIASLNVPGNRSAAASLPATFRAEWIDTISNGQRMSAAAIVRVWSVTRNGRTYERNDEWALECNTDRSVEIRLPQHHRVEITSDPSGASVFTIVRHSHYRSEEVFLGTTPLNASIDFEPGRTFTAIRLEKSGYETVQKEIRLSDSMVRVVMQPRKHGR